MFKFPKKDKKDGKQETYSYIPNIQSILNNSMIQTSRQAVHSQLQEVNHGLDQLQVADASPHQAQAATHNHRQSWISSTASIGQRAAFDKVCDFLGQSEVGMVGIYGIGGVGKTTLMKMVCNEFLKPSYFKVIWLVVSKIIDVGGIQKLIMRGLNLNFREDDDPQTRAMEINDAIVNYRGKIAILFDDIWEPLELDEIGVLGGNGLDTATFKVMFTTRSEDVCLQMHPDQKLKVECLRWDESWALFSRSVGEETLTSHYKIADLAKDVAKECAGLPLALTIIGRAMVSKTSLGAWEDALFTLRKSPSKVLGVEKKMFVKLKLSFDNLPNQIERDSFLFCCLFPEDKVIAREDLIECWVGEGLLDMDDGYQEASNRGDVVIDTLLSKLLLEKAATSTISNGLTLHDVVRDMGLWIASGLNLFVSSSMLKLKNRNIEDKWMAAKRVYLLANIDLPDLVASSNMSTMFVAGEYSAQYKYNLSNSLLPSLVQVKLFSTYYVDFLDKQPSNLGMLLGLRYLEIWNSNLTTLPPEIGNLKDLLVLKLVGNDSLSWLPATVGRLTELRVLYIISCTITMLNPELRNLSKLEIFVIDNYSNLDITEVPSVIFQYLTQLRTLTLKAIKNKMILPKILWSLNKLEKLDIMISNVFGNVGRNEEMSKDVDIILTCLDHLSSLKYLNMLIISQVSAI